MTGPCCVLASARVVQQQTGHPLTIAIWAAVPDVLLLVRQRVMDVGIAKHQIFKFKFKIDPEGSLGLVLSLKIDILLVTIFEIFNDNTTLYAKDNKRNSTRNMGYNK